VVPEASPVRGLAELAASLDADLLVVGSDWRVGVGRMLAGGVARRLLAAAPCPVAVAPAGYRDRPAEAPRVVGVAFDASPGALRAVAFAERLALGADATMRVIAADQRWYPGTDIVLSPSAAEDHERLRAELDATVACLDPRVRAQAKLLGGNAIHMLLEEAGLGIDVLVVGSRGIGLVKRALFGSVSREVVHYARCPVIVVPPAREDAIKPSEQRLAVVGY
jgi:nucleotide-binding universal stress UspA family protein